MASIIGATRLIKYKKFENLKRKPKPKHQCYVDRDEYLPVLGYSTYREYLASDEWREIRKAKLDRFPHCLLCDGMACQVHHMSYHPAVMLGLELRLLVTLCDTCHGYVEFDSRGRKNDLNAANRLLIRLVAAKGKRRFIQAVDVARRTIGRRDKKAVAAEGARKFKKTCEQRNSKHEARLLKKRREKNG